MTLHELFDSRFQEITATANLGYPLVDIHTASSYAFAYFQSLSYDASLLGQGGDYHPDCLITAGTADNGAIVVHKLGEIVMVIHKDTESNKLILSMSDNVEDGLSEHFLNPDFLCIRDTILYTLGAMVLLKMPMAWVLGAVDRMTSYGNEDLSVGHRAYDELTTYQEIMLILFDKLILESTPFIFQTIDLVRS